MNPNFKQKLYAYHNTLFNLKHFALWARPKNSQLNVKRTRVLCDNNEVIWYISKDGKNVSDHIEMSGFYASAIISYGSDEKGRLRLMKHLVNPTLRIQPNLTNSSFSHNFNGSSCTIKTNGKRLVEYPQKVTIKGNLKITSQAGFDTEITREFLPAVNQRALIEIITIKNNSASLQSYEVSAKKYSKVKRAFWCVGDSITAESSVVFDDKFKESSNSSRKYSLKPNACAVFYCVYHAFQNKKPAPFSLKEEINCRRKFIDEMFNTLTVETPFPELNAQFSHCILRGCESIFKTKNGLMHAPGGGNYYATLWTNDQCEYANPFFPYLGYQPAIEQSVNCYSLYENYMDKSDIPMKQKKPIVTSIISEGISYWNGAGDRGDSEMYAYGLSRFLLEMSDVKLIERFWESLVWCIDFVLSRKNEIGFTPSLSF